MSGDEEPAAIEAIAGTLRAQLEHLLGPFATDHYFIGLARNVFAVAELTRGALVDAGVDVGDRSANKKSYRFSGGVIRSEGQGSNWSVRLRNGRIDVEVYARMTGDGARALCAAIAELADKVD